MVEEFGGIHRAIVMLRSPLITLDYGSTANANNAVKRNCGRIV
jgi:hypothetical protein